MSTRSSLLERFGQRVQIRDEPRVSEGSEERIRLTVIPGQPTNTPVAARALTRRHLSLKAAHAALTSLVDTGEAYVTVPKVESLEALTAELRAVGVTAHRHGPTEISVREIREKMALSQAQFALKFGLEEATVKNWEQGKAKPNQAAKTLLWTIHKYPEAVISSIGNIDLSR